MLIPNFHIYGCKYSFDSIVQHNHQNQRIKLKQSYARTMYITLNPYIQWKILHFLPAYSSVKYTVQARYKSTKKKKGKRSEKNHIKGSLLISPWWSLNSSNQQSGGCCSIYLSPLRFQVQAFGIWWGCRRPRKNWCRIDWCSFLSSVPIKFLSKLYTSSSNSILLRGWKQAYAEPHLFRSSFFFSHSFLLALQKSENEN